MEFRGIKIKKEVYPYLYEYEMRGGSLTKEGKLYSENYMDQIIFEINQINEIYSTRKEMFGENKNVHKLN